VLIKTPVLVQKTPPLKPVRNFGVRNLVRGIKKRSKNTPAKTPYDEKVGYLRQSPVLVQKTPPLKPVRMFPVNNLVRRRSKKGGES